MLERRYKMSEPFQICETEHKHMGVLEKVNEKMLSDDEFFLCSQVQSFVFAI